METVKDRKEKFLKRSHKTKYMVINVLWNEINMIGKKMIDIKDFNFIISIPLIRNQNK